MISSVALIVPKSDEKNKVKKHDRLLSGSCAIIQAEIRKAVAPMKMERLIGILSILLQREKVTAPELAEQFEVSRRTIQRDIESLCRAGIPISTAQGAGGGISIMEGYRVDRTVLTAPETRSSSPVRILRGEDRQSEIKGLYPCGEGAGYAGGIMSAAVDGIQTAEAILEAMKEK